jgi:hypothetical protein
MYVILPFIFTAARQDDRRPPPYTTKFRNYEAKLSLGNSIASYLSLNEAYMQYENLTQDEIWAAIQYLDPDDRNKNRVSDTATILAALMLLLTGWAVWVLLWLRVHRL